MNRECPHCKKLTDFSQSNIFRPFCSEKCKLIDFGSWVKEEKLFSRPINSEDYLED